MTNGLGGVSVLIVYNLSLKFSSGFYYSRGLPASGRVSATNCN